MKLIELVANNIPTIILSIFIIATICGIAKGIYIGIAEGMGRDPLKKSREKREKRMTKTFWKITHPLKYLNNKAINKVEDNLKGKFRRNS